MAKGGDVAQDRDTIIPNKWQDADSAPLSEPERLLYRSNLQARIIEVNPEPTPFSGYMDLRLVAPAGEALPALADAMERCRWPTT